MRKIFIGLLLLIIIISVIGVSWLYPVSEISGYIKCQEIFYFDIHSNGDVDYYIGYYNIMTKGSENADLAKENIHMKKKLTLKQKYDINKCVKKIIGNDTKDKEKEMTYVIILICIYLVLNMILVITYLSIQIGNLKVRQKKQTLMCWICV